MAGREPMNAAFNPQIKHLDSEWGIPLNDKIEDLGKRHGFYANRGKFGPKGFFWGVVTLAVLPVVVYKLTMTEQTIKGGNPKFFGPFPKKPADLAEAEALKSGNNWVFDYHFIKPASSSVAESE